MKISSFISLHLRVGLSMYVGVCVMYNCVCVNAWQGREQYEQFGLDIISKLLVRIIEMLLMLSDAKAMSQQTDTHCERNTNANITDHRVGEKETRHKHT